MRLVIAFVAALTAVATSQIAIASVYAQGEAVVGVVGGEDEPAREWDIDVVGGIPSTDHITLAPIAVGFQGEFTVAVSGSAATVTLTTVLPADRELVSVGCLDDLTPPTEINPTVDHFGFTVDVVPGRRYRCFAESLPTVPGDAAAAPAGGSQAPTERAVPRSDASTTSPSAPSPGWLAVLVTLVVMAGIVLLLRPARR
jgi:hypothetical protein